MKIQRIIDVVLVILLFCYAVARVTDGLIATITHSSISPVGPADMIVLGLLAGFLAVQIGTNKE